MHRSTAALLHGSTILLLAAATQANAAEKVSIYRDDFGVPHVQAETSDAVMFGAGYAIAADRLAAMELARHNTQGRRAALLGASALHREHMMRGRTTSPATLIQRYKALEPHHCRMLPAMVAATNTPIQTATHKPPTPTT